MNQLGPSRSDNGSGRVGQLCLDQGPNSWPDRARHRPDGRRHIWQKWHSLRWRGFGIGGRIPNESTTTATGMVARDSRSQAGKGLAGDGVELEQSLGTAIFHGRPVVGIGSPDNVEGVGVVRGGNGCRGRLEFGPKVDDFWT